MPIPLSKPTSGGSNGCGSYILADGGVWGEHDRSGFLPSSSTVSDSNNKSELMRDASAGCNNFDANILWTLEVDHTIIYYYKIQRIIRTLLEKSIYSTMHC